jgi:hypothetical protein
VPRGKTKLALAAQLDTFSTLIVYAPQLAITADNGIPTVIAQAAIMDMESLMEHVRFLKTPHSQIPNQTPYAPNGNHQFVKTVPPDHTSTTMEFALKSVIIVIHGTNLQEIV